MRSLEMAREPNRRFLRLCPLDAMTFPCGDENVIAHGQRSRGRGPFGLRRGTNHKHDQPLVPRLIIPEVRWTNLPLRYDALDFQSRPGEDFAERLFSRAGGCNVRD